MADEERVPDGKGVDRTGGAVIDPTENVIALVKAGEASATALRGADQRFLDAQLAAYEKLQNFARDAESKKPLRWSSRRRPATLNAPRRSTAARRSREWLSPGARQWSSATTPCRPTSIHEPFPRMLGHRGHAIFGGGKRQRDDIVQSSVAC